MPAQLAMPVGTVRAHLAMRTSVVDREVVRWSRRNGVSAHEARTILAEQVRRALLEAPALADCE